MMEQELHLTLEDVAAGMTLARPVINSQGQVWMAAGAVLTDVAIADLRLRDVADIWVRNISPREIAPPPHETEQRTHHQERIAHLFRHANESADERYLLGLVMRYRSLETS